MYPGIAVVSPAMDRRLAIVVHALTRPRFQGRLVQSLAHVQGWRCFEDSRVPARLDLVLYGQPPESPSLRIGRHADPAPGRSIRCQAVPLPVKWSDLLS